MPRKPSAPDSLQRYREKRDFSRTAEPSPDVAAKRRSRQPLLVVQKHDASRLHWDLRLEADGVLKSWAVTRGPSIDPSDKRLAVRTEDHPLSYATFEGTIPKGEYGGGTVMLWDSGSWEPVPGKSAADIDAGHLHFIAHGSRMQGEWLLVRMKPRGKERAENWLLRKVGDDFAGKGDVLVERALTSVATGRTMDEIAQGKASIVDATAPKRRRAGAKAKASSKTATVVPPKSKGPKRAIPAFQPPALAELARDLPAGDDWLYEVKYDGYRCLLGIGKGGAKGWTRSGLDWSDRFAPVVTAAAALPVRSALLDGEIVALDDQGRPSFSALQAALNSKHPTLLFFVFDLLELDGADLGAEPLHARKKALAALLADAKPPLIYADHVTDGAALLKAMRDGGYEGVIAKRASRPYPGKRSSDWLKIKIERREEFVIVGWTPSATKGRAFSALLLGQYDAGQLVYKGKTGTGFSHAVQEDLRARFATLAADKSALCNTTATDRHARWLKPVLVAEVRYAEYTGDGVLRHAAFLGLREDKPAAEVVPEATQARSLSDANPAPITGSAAAPNAAAYVPPPPSVRISNADRPIFGDGGPTKGDLASWYEAIAPDALAWMADRPLSVVRCPRGIKGECFFQKHAKDGWGDAVGSVDVDLSDGSTEPNIVIADKRGLVQLAQMGCIEVHGWGCRASDLDRPDRLVFDLDPDEGLDFAAIKQAATDIRAHLADMGLVTFPMLSGGKGLHIIAPLTVGQAEWSEAENFCRRFATALEGAEPTRFTASMSKARRKGRIFVDWLRNQRGSTAVLPYSVRARPGAPVATPINWAQLDAITAANIFTLSDPAAILAQRDMLEPGWGHADQSLPEI